MPDQASSARPLTALRSRALRGRFKVAPEPMLFALAAMLAALARGDSVLFHDAAEFDPDLAATQHLLEAVGAPPQISDDRWEIAGLGPRGLLNPERPLDFAGAGRAAPLAMGLLGPYGFGAEFVGEDPGRGGPLTPVIEALRGLGIDIREQRSGKLPLRLQGPRTPVPFIARLPRPSLEAKAALLLAALALPGISTLVEVQPAPDHAERLLRYFGAHIVETTAMDGSRSLEIVGMPPLGARTVTIAGDPDLAAFPLVAALVVPDSDVIIENVLLHTARNSVLSALEEMGGSIEITDRRMAAGEEVADLRVRHSPLLGTSIDPRGLSPAAVPPLAIAGAFAAGETRIPMLGFAGEAALHEALATGLNDNGATARADRNGLVVGRPRPGGKLGGQTLLTGGNPYLAAAFAVFGLAAAEQVTIADETAFSAAFPEMVAGLESLGASFYRRWAA